MQSPIALNSRTSGRHTARGSISYHHMSTIRLVDRGTTVSALAEPGGVLDLDGLQYTLIEIHSHAPSEHTIDGHRADLETHLVHESAEGKLAVLGVMFDVDEGEHPIDQFIGRATDSPTMAHLERIVPTTSPAFRYLGSLTTPPYTSGIEWTVFSQRLTVGREALHAFAESYGPNARDLQDDADTVVTFG